ncbi:hypothetical protein BC830DRAFT_1147005 [Chytriomyces sp. MP71]|nr:hypothetical protein BC830DRAFT_1147005 [Chytriomyces sp. MP71]
MPPCPSVPHVVRSHNSLAKPSAAPYAVPLYRFSPRLREGFPAVHRSLARQPQSSTPPASASPPILIKRPASSPIIPSNLVVALDVSSVPHNFEPETSQLFQLLCEEMRRMQANQAHLQEQIRALVEQNNNLTDCVRVLMMTRDPALTVTTDQSITPNASPPAMEPAVTPIDDFFDSLFLAGQFAL